MEVLPSSNFFKELEHITDTGCFEYKRSLEDCWQQTWFEMGRYLQDELREGGAGGDGEWGHACAVASPHLYAIADEPVYDPLVGHAGLKSQSTNSRTADVAARRRPGYSDVPVPGYGIECKPTPPPKPTRCRYICDFPSCYKSYTNNWKLKTHKLKHTGEKQYKCLWGVCQSSFFSAYELVRHTRIHTGAKPYRCEYCKRNFSRSDHVKSHLKLNGKCRAIRNKVNQTCEMEE